MRRMRLGGFVVLAACLVPAVAQAGVPDPWGPYVGMDLGMTVFNVQRESLDDLLGRPAGTSSLDATDPGYSLVVGFRFSKYLAVEGSWLDLGSATYRLDNGDADLKLGSQAAALSVLANFPLNSAWSLEGRVGVYFSNARLHGWLSVATQIGSGGIEDIWLEGEGGSDAAGVLGVGIVRSLSERWTVRLGYEYFTDNAIDVRETTGGDRLDTSASRWLLGVRYRF